MKLSPLLEDDFEARYVDHDGIERELSKLGWELNIDYVIEPEPDSTVKEAHDVHGMSLKVPSSWIRFPVKFGDFSRLDLVIDKGSRLRSLKNGPTTVERFFVSDVANLTSLRGAPSRVNGDCGLHGCSFTSLIGAPKDIEMQLTVSGMKLLRDLRGLENTSVKNFSIGECHALETLDGMPRVEKNVWLENLSSLKAVRFPDGFSFESNYGQLLIGPSLAHMLSPSLVLVPGLKNIEWGYTTGHRDDILKLFNKHLRTTVGRREAYFHLQQDLIDSKMEWMAEL